MQVSGALNMEPGEVTVRFANLGREVIALAGETLLHCARRNGVRINSACGGGGSCGSCLVRVVSGSVELVQGCHGAPTSAPAGSARTEVAEEAGKGVAVASAPGRPAEEQGWLRACLVRPLGDCVVEVAPRSLATVVRTDVEGDGAGASFPFAPLVRSFAVEILPPALAEADGDLERFQEGAGGTELGTADLGALRTLPTLLRDNGWHLRGVARGGELIGFTPPGGRTLGLAVDLGTTNAAAYLSDLESGALLASLGMENPQVAYGADLISRVNHAVRSPEGGRELQKAAAGAIASLAADLCASVGALPDVIADLAVCGNTAMHHLLLGLPVAQLGRSPFVPAACAPLDLKARDLGIEVLPGAYLHVMPNVGGFVGGDHVAALLATEEIWRDGTTLVIDIGTNTELSLAHRGLLITASTASGPALEGGNISCGMRAAQGAIERVRAVGGEIRTEVIGGGEGVGLCGSGVLDALAALLKAGIVDRRGRILAGHPSVRDLGERREFLLAPRVSFTQDDVRSVQLAKAAIRAGIDLLLEQAGVAEEEIARVVVAGAFGVYLDVASAVGIGMFPPLPQERFLQVGNAAGVGVRMALSSAAARERGRELARACRHLELGVQPALQKIFLKRIGL